MSVFVKDPNATLDFACDWSAWLQEDETIVTSEWLPPDGITAATESVTGGKAIVWLSGGTVGESYQVTNRITTSAGRIDDRTMTIRVRQR